MARTIGTLLAIFVLGFCLGGFGQTKAEAGANTTLVSGRIVDPNGTPLAGMKIEVGSPIHERSDYFSDADGLFSFAATHNEQSRLLVSSGREDEVAEVISALTIANGQQLDLGSIVFNSANRKKPTARLIGPVRIQATPIQSTSANTQARKPKAVHISVVYIACPGAFDEACNNNSVHVLFDDGKEIRQEILDQKIGDMAQRAFSNPLISPDRRMAGWLVEYDNCCTSYPLPLELRLYQPGKPVRAIPSCESSIWGWDFEAGGKQIAMYSNFPHGDNQGCFEVFDAITGRSLRRWEGGWADEAVERPEWVKKLRLGVNE
jgi:hypothetical protein